MLLGLATASCKVQTQPVFQTVDIDAQDFLKESALGWFPRELSGRIAAALSANGLPVLKEGARAPANAQLFKGRLNLESQFSPPRGPGPALVAVAAVFQIKGKDLGSINSVSAQREVGLKGNGPEDRREATVHAVEGVLDDIAAEAAALVKATNQKDDELVKGLESTDARTRVFAMKVLADRRNPAAVPALLEQLKSENLDVVRGAIGSLVELKDPRAVPVMIDASHARDNLFQREVVFALGSIGGDEAQAYLFTMAQGHDEPVVRASAQQALDELTAKATERGNRK